MPTKTRDHILGDPTPKSPETVSHDSEYEVMKDYVAAQYYPSADEIIVKHKATNTFWLAVYGIDEDDSGYRFNTTWRRVVPHQITMTQYESFDES